MSRKLYLVVVALALAAVALPALAATTTWTGNGTTSGLCNDLRYDGSVTQGQQVWLFVLTRPGTGPYTLTYAFQDGPSGNATGTQMGGGAVHFTVTTDEGAQLLSAFANTGDQRSVLTVSHCSVNPPPLQVSKDAATSFTRTHEWSISKTANPDAHDLNNGQSGTTTYSVVVQKTGYQDSGWSVSGNIYITNVSQLTATISSVVDNVSNGGQASVSCPTYVLSGGGSTTCTYGPLALSSGEQRLNTATVTTTGLVPGNTATADVIFGAPTTEVNATVDVTDTYAGTLATGTGGGTFTYDRTFMCGADAGQHDNTATIVQTGQSDDASVTVTCHVPQQGYWCSPGFWKTGIDPEKNNNLLGSAYDPTPYLNDIVPDYGITVGEALDTPSSPAYNPAADYLSSKFFNPAGTQSTGENCPLNARGEWTAG